MRAHRAGKWWLWLVFWPIWASAQICDVGELQHDVRNCGTCGNACSSLGINTLWECRSGNCQASGCAPGYYDLDSNGICEYACNYVSPGETCNNIDDNCNGQVDEGLVAPSPVQVCGVSPIATTAECTTGVGVSCQGGAWTCTFGAGVCNGPNCASTTEVCDTVDNNCNGLINENVANFGKACASDDGLAPPGHGLCRGVGTIVCAGPNSTACNAIQQDCASLPGGCTEQCDGIDNDCDAAVDETFNNPGFNAAHFVRPAVTRIGATSWMYQYEASRPLASTSAQGLGNGYGTVAPPGSTYDQTSACSVMNRLPWTEINGQEAEQVCQRMGGSLCAATDFVTACQIGATNCLYGYTPRGTACVTSFTGSKYCNLGLSFDANGVLPGDQDGLLPTRSAVLQSCSADWSALQGNTAAQSQIYDLSGNVRELVRMTPTDFRGFGGSLVSRSEFAGSCNLGPAGFSADHRASDLGFRCCFTSNPSP